MFALTANVYEKYIRSPESLTFRTRSCCCFSLRRVRKPETVDVWVVEAQPSLRGRGFGDDSQLLGSTLEVGAQGGCSDDAGESGSTESAADKDGEATHEPGKPAPVADRQWVVYRVRPGDSLLGIALKFRTDVPTLLRANRLTTPASFNVCSTLLVPSSGVDVGTLLDEQATAQEEETARVRAAKVSLLRAAAKREQGSSREHVMTEQEAEFYLTEADGDFQAARRLYLEDLEWEKDGGQITRHALLAASVIQPETWASVLAC